MLIIPLLAKAQNPIIRDQFTADPTARVFNNKLYLYPSHDIMPPQGVESCQGWFCMEDYHVFSSDNLTQWRDHGTIFSQYDVPWANNNTYSLWAPDCIYRNGKYYFYFSAQSASDNLFRLGVAIGDSPEGPFVPEPEPIKDIRGIDPCVLQASDGNAYLFWQNGRCAMLKPNMKELVDDTPIEITIFNDLVIEMPGHLCLDGLPDNQAEGPFAFEYNGNFYLTYSNVRNDTEVLAYAMSKNPLGPYEYKGIIMAEHANGCWTNHLSIVNFKEEWYIFYHHNAFSPNDDKRRSVQIEKLQFNPDGTIQEVKETMRGVGINQATEKIEIDRYSSASEDVTTGLIDVKNPFLSFQATLPKKGSWLKYNDVDFTSIKDGYLIMNVNAADNTKFCIREKSIQGKIISCIEMKMSNQWLTQTANLEYVPSGVIDLVITNESEGSISIDWITFINSNDDSDNEIEEVSANIEVESDSNSEED
ncbi:carbohydrate-binding module family 6 protein [Piromyces sp. E2]|nr:carbohydrate-binding module family 6 protein [Piromyces sp. E2]|eukprot:OUM59081.1 carbohydrate-binding module family 6 protein [Piromyces sp. E2]